MALISIRDLSIGFYGPPLLDEASCQIEPKQRIGLLGRNGAGKTTLLRIIAGDVAPDHGQVVVRAGSVVSLLPQDVPQGLTGSVSEVVAEALQSIDAAHRADEPHRVDAILSRMQLDAAAPFQRLSSGMKRRVLLARSLVLEPDVLLLDEPTNHLDIDAITWLEEFLERWPSTLIFVTHDRMFLRKMANRILEIDRGRLFDWTCDYETFLARKEAALDAEEKQNALFDKRLAEEERWIRQGIKARRTRNEGRVRALQTMRRERADRRDRAGNVRLAVQTSQRSGNLVVEAEELSYGYGDRPIVENFSTMIMRGDKIGVIGPNGAGKTTLLRLLLGELQPQGGRLRLGVNLQIAYFDQLREQLDDERTVADNVGDGYDTIGIGENRQHLFGYLQRFLFSAERARTPVKFLSGGERNRLLLARLFAKPANVIVLDEPTNDLDAETLELLESMLVDFQGTVLVVSHDREFLNNVVTSTIVFQQDGVHEYCGGYDDWQRQRPARETPSEMQVKKPTASQAGRSESSQADGGNGKPRKLKFNEKRELEQLPSQIEQLEAEIAQRHEAMARPEFYQSPGDEIAQETERVRGLESRLATAYQRWEELEGISR